MLQGEKVSLRFLNKEDLRTVWEFIYGQENPEWKKWDAPYFPLKYMDFETYETEMLNKIKHQIEPRMVIIADGQIIGIVSYYWEHEPSQWLEVGIVIYEPQYWSGGYGTEALKLWIDHLFEVMPIHRIGLTTWSGNHRMMKVAEKLGMILEGRMRKCRQYNGEYYDSIKMGVLKEEWFNE